MGAKGTEKAQREGRREGREGQRERRGERARGREGRGGERFRGREGGRGSTHAASVTRVSGRTRTALGVPSVVLGSMSSVYI